MFGSVADDLGGSFAKGIPDVATAKYPRYLEAIAKVSLHRFGTRTINVERVAAFRLIISSSALT